MKLLKVGVKRPLVGDPDGHDRWKGVERVRPCRSLGAVVDERAVIDPGDLAVGEHCSGRCSFLDEARELANYRDLETGHLADHPDGGVCRCFSRTAGVAWQ